MTNKTPSSNSPTEHETRKQYIDAMLRDAGWRLGADWLEEVELQLCGLCPLRGQRQAPGGD